MFGMSGLGGPGTAAGRFSTTRGRINGGAQHGVNYPSPFFDIAHTYLPATVKQMFRWCRYYFLTNPLINATCFKLSEYPITELLIDHENPVIRRRWEEFFNDHLRFRPFQIECGLDYHVYGNSMISLGLPFQKYLKCQFCQFSEKASKIRQNWTFTNFAFRLNCPNCGTTSEAIPSDFYYKDAGGIRPIRWNCENVEVNFNELSGETTYFYTIPANVRNDVMIGKKDVVEGVPQIFIQSMRERKGVVFAKDNFFHMKRPTLAQQDRGWGIPLALPCLKDVFLLQVMKKAQECVAPETLIETDRGLVTAGSIVPGTLVKTHLGRYQPIVAKKFNPMVEDRGDFAVKISMSGIRQLAGVYSNNHPMYVLRRNDKARRADSKEMRRSSYVLRNPSLYDFEWVDASKVAVGDYLGYPIARLHETRVVDLAEYVSCVVTDSFIYTGVGEETAHAFEALEREEHVFHDSAGRVAKRHLKNGTAPNRSERFLELTEELAYIAGWYVGDGSIGARRVDFSMGPDDDGTELQQALEDCFNATCSRYPCKESKKWTLCASNSLLSETISSWIPGDARTKMIPKELMEAPDEIVLAFLRGYLEADGYTKAAIRHKEVISVTCANKQLTYQLRCLLISLGCISTISESLSYESTIINALGAIQQIPSGLAVFSWTVKSKSARRLLQLMEDKTPEVVESGKSGFFVKGYFAARVNAVDVVPCEQVVSLEVAEDHTFCTAGVATHNTLMVEHIVPMRILFPQAGSSTSDPYTSINLIDWKEHVSAEIARWRQDQNYIPVLPLPIGNQTLGGDGKALLLTAEMQEIGRQIMAGMGVPSELLYGGLSYSGSNVSLRMLENQFLGYILRQQQMATWIMKRVASYMGWPEVGIRFRPFKMADDIQRKAYLFQLNQANKISDSTLLADVDLDQTKEDETMLRETSRRLSATKKQQLAMADIQGEAQVIMAKSQAKAQQTMMTAQAAGAAPGEPGDAMSQMGSPLNLGQSQGAAPAPGGQAAAGIDIQQMAQMLATQITSLPPQDQELALANLKAQSPELSQLVEQLVQQMMPEVDPTMGMGANGAAASTVNTQPLPEARAPRRAAATI